MKTDPTPLEDRLISEAVSSECARAYNLTAKY